MDTGELIEPLLCDNLGVEEIKRFIVLNDVDGLKAAIDAGCKVDVVDVDGWAPVHYAVFHDRLECLRALLKAGANGNRLTTNGQNLLHCLALQPDVEHLLTVPQSSAELAVLLRTLKLTENKVDSSGWTPLLLVDETCETSKMKLLLELSLSILENFIAASSRLNVKALTVLAQMNTKINNAGYFTRVLATVCDHLDDGRDSVDDDRDSVDDGRNSVDELLAKVKFIAKALAEHELTYVKVPLACAIFDDLVEICRNPAGIHPRLASDGKLLHDFVRSLFSSCEVSQRVFMVAIKNDALDVARLLLAAGIKIPVESGASSPPMSALFRAKSEEMADLLLDSLAYEDLNVNVRMGTFLAVVQKRCGMIMGKLLKAGWIFQPAEKMTFGEMELGALQKERSEHSLGSPALSGLHPVLDEQTISGRFPKKRFSVMGVLLRYWGDTALEYVEAVKKLGLPTSDTYPDVLPETVAAVLYYVDRDETRRRLVYPMLDWLESQGRAGEINMDLSEVKPVEGEHMCVPLVLLAALKAPSVLFEVLRRGGNLRKLVELWGKVPLKFGRRYQFCQASINSRVLLLNLLVMAHFAGPGVLSMSAVDRMIAHVLRDTSVVEDFKRIQRRIYALLKEKLEPGNDVPSLFSLSCGAVIQGIQDTEGYGRVVTQKVPPVVRRFLPLDVTDFPFAESHGFYGFQGPRLPVNEGSS